MRVDPWTGSGLHIEVNALLTQDIILEVSTVNGLRKCLDSIIASLLVSSTFKVAIVWFSTNNFWLIVGQGSFGSWNCGAECECTTNQYLPNIARSRNRELEIVPCFQIFWANIILESIFLFLFQRALYKLGEALFKSAPSFWAMPQCTVCCLYSTIALWSKTDPKTTLPRKKYCWCY